MLKRIEENLEQISAICRRFDVKRLDLFGSAAHDDFNPEKSDLDFLVQFNNYTIHNAADRYFDLLSDLEGLFGRKIDLVSDRAIQNPYFRKAVDAERVNLYAA